MTIEALLDALYAPDAAHGLSLATVVMQSGTVIAERYGHQPETIFGPGGPITDETPLISWSTAKSITHALVGLAVDDGLVRVNEPAPVPEWRGTPKEAITVQHLLEMRPGLLFVEDYVDDSVSHCLEMLFGPGAHDVARYAADLPLVHEPGTQWNYSSGTTNILCRIVADALAPRATDGGRAAVEQYLHERLFAPVGMTTARPSFDDAGTFIGSSYVHASARDFARFGELYRNDGMVDGRRLLPNGWVDHARTVAAHDVDFDYGCHWWVWRDLPGSLAAHGYEGQYIIVAPSRELVVAHFGKSPIERRPLLVGQLRQVVEAMPEVLPDAGADRLAM